MEEIRKVFSQADLFGVHYQFSYKDKAKKGSAAGGVLSAVLMVLLGLAVLQINTQAESVPQVVSDLQVEEPGQLLLDGKMFAFGFSQAKYNQPYYFDISAKHYVRKVDEQGKESLESTRIDLIACTLEQFKTGKAEIDSKIARTFRYYQMENLLCPSQQLKVQLQGQPGPEIFSYVKVEVKACTLNCKEVLHNRQHYLDIDLRFRLFTKSIFQSIQLSSEIIFESNRAISEDIYMQSINTMDKAVFRTEYQVESSLVGLDRIERIERDGNQAGYLIKQVIRSSHRQKVIYKSQGHYLNVLGLTGGLISLLMLIGHCLIHSHNRSLAEQELAHHFFEFPETSKNKNQVAVSQMDSTVSGVTSPKWWQGLFCWNQENRQHRQITQKAVQQMHRQFLDIGRQGKSVQQVNVLLELILDKQQRQLLLLTQKQTIQVDSQLPLVCPDSPLSTERVAVLLNQVSSQSPLNLSQSINIRLLSLAKEYLTNNHYEIQEHKPNQAIITEEIQDEGSEQNDLLKAIDEDHRKEQEMNKEEPKKEETPIIRSKKFLQTLAPIGNHPKSNTRFSMPPQNFHNTLGLDSQVQNFKMSKVSKAKQKQKKEDEKPISNDSSLLSDRVNQQAFDQHQVVTQKEYVKKSKTLKQKKIVFNRPQDIITKND